MERARAGLRGWIVVSLTLTLAACGGDEEDGAAAAGGGNSAPTIVGTPAASVAQGAAYSFAPTATDPDGDPLIFGIEARPTWAQFDTATGVLSGTPTAADVGTHRGIVVWVSDGKTQTTLPAFELTVMAPPSGGNRAPTISGAPATAVVVGSQYTFTPTASDADAQPLTFSIRNRPSWATFTPSTGRLQGTPPSTGTFANITISVSDGQVAVPLPAFTISVTPPPVNRAPVISGAPMTSVEAGTAYTFVPTASDPDGDTLTFAIAGRPSWAGFDTSTGRLSGTPPTGTTGTFGNIRISVSDGPNTAQLPAFSIVVTARTSNRPPTISGSPPTTATEGALYSFTPSASDPDGNALTFSIANRPSWATFNATNGRLQGTPGASHVRTWSNIVISVSDGIASTPLGAFSIAVAGANAAPTITGTPATTATVGTQYSFTPLASDADGDALTFTIANAPSWATFNTTTGRLQGTPGAGNVGTFGNIRIGVTDGTATAQLAAFSIVVSDAGNRPPTISGAPPTAVTAGTAYSFTPTASDPDGDSLTFSVANAPVWATFSTTTGRLSGTPGAQHVGTTTGVVIRVNDGETTVSLPAFNLAVQGVATGSATLTWTPPTTNIDGSPLTNLAGYRVYWGTSLGDYPNSTTLSNPGLTSYVVTNLTPGTWYFVATAVNSAGGESAFSGVGSKTIQ
jgi:hypothetical protein